MERRRQLGQILGFRSGSKQDRGIELSQSILPANRLECKYHNSVEEAETANLYQVLGPLPRRQTLLSIFTDRLFQLGQLALGGAVDKHELLALIEAVAERALQLGQHGGRSGAVLSTQLTTHFVKGKPTSVTNYWFDLVVAVRRG